MYNGLVIKENIIHILPLSQPGKIYVNNNNLYCMIDNNFKYHFLNIDKSCK